MTYKGLGGSSLEPFLYSSSRHLPGNTAQPRHLLCRMEYEQMLRPQELRGTERGIVPNLSKKAELGPPRGRIGAPAWSNWGPRVVGCVQTKRSIPRDLSSLFIPSKCSFSLARGDKINKRARRAHNGPPMGGDQAAGRAGA